MNRARKTLAILLIISIIAVAGVRAIVYGQRQTLEVQRRATRLAGMDTFALGLILGGLRGAADWRGCGSDGRRDP